MCRNMLCGLVAGLFLCCCCCCYFFGGRLRVVSFFLSFFLFFFFFLFVCLFLGSFFFFGGGRLIFFFFQILRGLRTSDRKVYKALAGVTAYPSHTTSVILFFGRYEHVVFVSNVKSTYGRQYRALLFVLWYSAYRQSSLAKLSLEIQ